MRTKSGYTPVKDYTESSEYPGYTVLPSSKAALANSDPDAEGVHIYDGGQINGFDPNRAGAKNQVELTSDGERAIAVPSVPKLSSKPALRAPTVTPKTAPDPPKRKSTRQAEVPKGRKLLLKAGPAYIPLSLLDVIVLENKNTLVLISSDGSLPEFEETAEDLVFKDPENSAKYNCSYYGQGFSWGGVSFLVLVLKSVESL